MSPVPLLFSFSFAPTTIASPCVTSLNSEVDGAAATSNFGEDGDLGDFGEPFFDPVGDPIHEGLPRLDDMGDIGEPGDAGPDSLLLSSSEDIYKKEDNAPRLEVDVRDFSRWFESKSSLSKCICWVDRFIRNHVFLHECLPS